MASSSSTINSPKYDVFLSFRGADTRNNFTSHLYNALRKEGVNVFMDKELKRGEKISSTLFLIIEGAQVSIVVFSPNYAASKFCLEELVKILECKVSKQQVVLPVFYKVDPFEVEKLTGEYGKAISSHEAEFKGFKQLFYTRKTLQEKMEKVKRWKSALTEAADLAGWDLRDRDEFEVISTIVEYVLHKLHRKHLERGPFEGSSVLDVPNREVFPEKTLVGGNFEINKGMIWAWLTNDDVSSIGIWGMGGVGKTTLLIHIYNKLLDKQEVFGRIYWVTVSQDFSVFRLQNLIAKTIGLEFGDEEDVMIRAARILKALSSKGKFVLILDDLWNHFDVEMVGIPIRKKGCKLIITTRISDVCSQMNLQMSKKIEPLSEDEAWYLFNETLGHDLALNVEAIAKAIVRECDGLPLGIVTMAGSMRGVDDMHEWQNALTELRRSEVRLEDMGDKVFRVLGFSYTRLNHWNLQQCLLYCALFPEDYEIDRSELIQLLIAEGIIERHESMRVDFDKGHAMLNKLIKVSLLEDVGRSVYGTCVKMHDLIRDMAIQTMKKSSPSIIEAGRQLKHIPVEKYWTKDIQKVSLMKNDIKEIPYCFSPICHTLSTLLLSQNFELESIPESLFLHLHGLKVLDLSYTQIGILPQSVGCLGNLKALLLQNCGNLYDMSSLAKLESLEIVDLSFCRTLKQVPAGLKLLSKLTLLNLHGTRIKKLRPGMVGQLPHLQFLACSGYAKYLYASDRSNVDSLDVKAEELAELQKLEYLSWWFSDFGEYNKYVKLIGRMQSSVQLTSYFLSVGRPYVDRNIKYPDEVDSREVFFLQCDICSELFLIKDLKILRMDNVVVNNGHGFCFKMASEVDTFETKLKSLSMFFTSCVGIAYLFHLSSSPSIFENIESLNISDLQELCALFGCEEVAPSTAMSLLVTATTFSSLKQLKIRNCNGMKKLFPATLIFNFKSLETIVVKDCSEMEEIIAAAEDEASCCYNSSTLMDTGFNLPNLQHLKLLELPKLRSICSEQIICYYPEIVIGNCPDLKKIPISCTLQSLQTLRLSVWPPEWWESVEWGSPNQKELLRPVFDRFIYGLKF